MLNCLKILWSLWSPFPNSLYSLKALKLSFNFQTFLYRGHFYFLFSRLYNLSSNKVGFEALYAPASEVPFYMYWLWCLIITKGIIIQLNGVDISLNCLYYFHCSSFEFNYHISIFGYNICFYDCHCYGRYILSLNWKRSRVLFNVF